MRKIQLGLSDLEVSILGLGCINYGTTVDQADAFRLMDCYLENGGNLLDTANNYAFWNKGGVGGESEKVIGKWLISRGRRDKIILATKVGALPLGSSKDFSAIEGLGAQAIYNAVEKSLKNLQTDYIDLLYLHVDDYQTPQEETLAALNKVMEKGYVRQIGCSNFRTWRIESARSLCRQNSWKFFCAVQQRCSYLAPTSDANFFPQVSADKSLEEYIDFYKDITLVAHTPLLNGLYFKNEIDVKEYDTRANRDRLELIHKQQNPVNWVLREISHQYGGTVVLSTTSNTAHLEKNIKAMDE